MLTYNIKATFANGQVLTFEVYAKTAAQAKKFGVQTANQMASSRGIRAKLDSIEVEEYYDDFN